MSFRTSSSESERAFERVRRSWVRNSVRAGRSCVRPPVLDLNAAYSPMECCDSSPLSLPLPMARITEILSARFPHEGKESRNQFPHSQIRKRCYALQRLGANDHLVEWPPSLNDRTGSIKKPTTTAHQPHRTACHQTPTNTPRLAHQTTRDSAIRTLDRLLAATSATSRTGASISGVAEVARLRI